MDRMTGFSSSDDDNEETDTTPLKIDWMDLESLGCEEKLGITALPGFNTRAKLSSIRIEDVANRIDVINDDYCAHEMDVGLRTRGEAWKVTYTSDVKDLFCLCTRGELGKYRVPRLIQALDEADINVHHFGFIDGTAPSLSTLLKILDELKVCLKNGKKSVVHCLGGLGRSCLVAVCLMMLLDESLGSEEAIKKIRELRGPAAIQSVKQFNFVNEFRQALSEVDKEDVNSGESVSR